MYEINKIIFTAFEMYMLYKALLFYNARRWLSTVRIIPIYPKVLHSELVSLEPELASTSFILCDIKLATGVLMYLCLQNRYMTKVVDISEIIEDVNMKISTI